MAAFVQINADMAIYYRSDAVLEAMEKKTSAANRSKHNGVVRKVDELGRIVLPVDLRRALDINEKDDVEIRVDGTSIILKKYCPTCVFCGSTKRILKFKDRNICISCVSSLKSLDSEA